MKSTKEIEIEIFGDPKPLARPRFGKGRAYDSQKEEKIAFGWEIKQEIAKRYGQNISPLCSPVRIEIIFGMPLPRLSMKKTREWVGRPAARRPDLSNLVKFVEDAAIGILFEDDNVVVELQARKIYRLRPSTILRIARV